VEFAYDPFGRRIEKKTTSPQGVNITRYVYDHQDIILELDGSGTIGNRYLHGPGVDEPLALNQGGRTYYYHADGLGSIAALTDERGRVVQDYQYDSYGNLHDRQNRVKQPYTYTGREYDRETGLYYYRARYYDAQIGRFITKDPIGFAGGDVNLYGYVLNNPINLVDPWGLWYIDLNLTGSARGTLGPGGTIGLLIGSSGINFYYGFGLGVGAGVSATFNLGEMKSCNSIDVGVTFSGGYPVLGVPIGAHGTISIDMEGNITPDFGVGLGLGFGISAGVTHRIPLLRW
jgi:RHS repeat-associated protein